MSRVGMAANMLRQGNSPAAVAKAWKLPLEQVESIAREVEARQRKERLAAKPRKPHLYSDKSPAIRRDIAELPAAASRFPAPSKQALIAHGVDTESAAKPANHGKPYSPEDDRRLADLVESAFPHPDVAAIMGRSYSSIASRCKELDLRQPIGARAAISVRAIYQARYYLRRGDHITALHVLEAAISSKKGE